MLGETKAIEAIKKNPKYFYSYAKKFSSLSNTGQPGVVACTCNPATWRLCVRAAWVRNHCCSECVLSRSRDFGTSACTRGTVGIVSLPSPG